jgi:predicted dehydrogenase
MDLEGSESLMAKIKARGIKTYTAFNFRFHPLILWLKENLKGKRVLEVQAYCGSYLPDWRPGRNYRDVYSAKAELGGGVHLDLIHELDYLLWLFGEPDSLQSDRGKVSDLEIDSFDVARYWLSYNNFYISVLLNYYRRDPKRQLELVLEGDTWIADLLNGCITNASGSTLFEDTSPVIETYTSQLKYFLEGLDSNEDYMNNLDESLNTLSYALS